MKYLIIAYNHNGVWQASFFERKNDTAYVFDYIELSTRNLDEINVTNFREIGAGRIHTDNIDANTEHIMRFMGFRKCDICGAWVTPQDCRNGNSVYDGYQRKCALCKAKDKHEYLSLADYHDTEDDVRVINGAGENFTLRNVLGIGIEWEYYNGSFYSDRIKCTDTFYEHAKDNALNRLFRVERDGTVTGEIISNVFTKKTLYDFDCKEITDVLLLNGNIEGNDEAGLHVHFSNTWLGTDEKEQCLNFLKLQYFMKSYEEDFLRMSQRKRERMNFCKFFNYEEIEMMKTDIIRSDEPWDYMPHNHGGGRGCALNSSGDTIEYRIGRNTNDPVRMKHYLRFLLGIVENIKNVPFSKCYCIRKVTRLVPEDTMNYWRKQGCFLRTNAIDERGVTLG